MTSLIRILCVIIGYGFGLFQTGYLYGRSQGVDIRTKGSGNTGATNALRVFGLKGGLIVLFFDALKAFLPCLAVRLIFKGDPYWIVYLVYVAFGVALGNNYPCWLQFKGGKGVATTLGWALAWDPLSTGIGLVWFFFVAVTTGYVSLASITTALGVVALALVYGYRTFVSPFESPVFIEFFLMVVVLMTLLILRHRSNIRRLFSGTENRFGHKKKES